jgi:integrase
MEGYADEELSSAQTDEVVRVSQVFRRAYAEWDLMLSVLGIKTGCRISELLSLRVGDI